MTPKLSGSRYVVPAFVLVIAVFVSCDLVTLQAMRGVQQQNRTLVRGVLEREQLVARIEHDLESRRLLVDAHIFEKSISNMSVLEREIGHTDAALDSAMDAFEHQIDGATVRDEFEALRSDILSLDAPLQAVLDLSRVNRDDEARAALEALMPRFEAVDKKTETLAAADRVGAERAIDALSARQLWLEELLVGVALIGIGAAAVIMFATHRAIRAREDRVAEATARLEERNRELDAFAGRVAHDLRGPLSAVSLAADRLAEKAPADTATTGVLRRGVTRMETLIRDLLALARVDSYPATARSDPATVTAAVVEELAPRVESVGGALDVDVAHASLRCSEPLLRDLLANLLDNAVKYRGSSPLKIVVRGAPAATGYAFRVSDNGIGMSRDDTKHVFEPFYRSPRAPKGVPGTGLGLSIVRRIVEACSGRLAVESEVNAGTTFRVELPFAEQT